MTRTDDQMVHETIDDTIDESMRDAADGQRARKRAEIGLAPNRPTARADLQRPPTKEESPDASMRWLAWLLGGVLVITLLLVMTKLSGAPTSWAYVRAQTGAWLSGATPGAYTTYDAAVTAPYRRLVALDFDAGAAGLAEEELPSQHQIYADQNAGVYHMRVWPGNLAWSVLGKVCLGPFRVETSASVASTASDGYAGLLGRFQNARSFYLFALNGEGEYRVTLLLDGEWQTLQPWTAAPAINLAGGENILALTDDGRTLSFFGNDTLLFALDTLELPAGNTGLAGGAVSDVTDITFDWLRLYDLPCREP